MPHFQHIKRFPTSLLQPPPSPLKPFSPLFFSSSSSSSSLDDDDTHTHTHTRTLLSILTHQRSKSRWNTLRSLCPTPIHPSQFSLIALHLRNNPHLALRFFHFTRSTSLCHHSLSSFSTLIHLLSRSRLYSHAYRTIRLALTTSTPFDLFQTLVKTYPRCGSSPFVFDLLIKASLDSNNIDPSIQIVRMLLSRGITPKVTTLNSLISRVSRFRGFDAGYAIFREVFRLDEAKGGEISKRGCCSGLIKVEPNVHTYNELMLCCYQDGLFERVEGIWNEMGCARNAYSYSVLMAALCDEGRMRDADKLWGEMRNEGIEPDVVSFNTMIGGFCKVGDVDRGEEFFREMALRGIDGTASTYEYLVKGYCNNDDVDSAVLVYVDMFRKDLRPDASTVDVMATLLCDKGRVKEALELVRNAVGKFGLVPKEESYEALIKGLCLEGKMEEALKVQAEMVGKGFRPNSEIYGAFIDGYVRQGNEELAGALRNEMLRSQMQS